MIKEFQSNTSLMDFLQQIMPDFKGHFILMRKPKHNSKAANALFAVWKDEKNKVNEKTVKRPATCSMEDVTLMEREGLVRQHGEKLEITTKGAEVIKTMILGDDRSIWEEKGKDIVDFETAFANTKAKRTKLAKKASQDDGSNWYRKLK